MQGFFFLFVDNYFSFCTICFLRCDAIDYMIPRFPTDCWDCCVMFSASVFVTDYNFGYCQEPLRGSISNHLRNLVQSLNIASELLEQAVQLVTNDNLDLGCAVIEQAATEKVGFLF